MEGREGRLGEMPSKGQKRKRDDNDDIGVGLDVRNDADDNDGGPRDDGTKYDTQEDSVQNVNDSLRDGSETSEDEDEDDDEDEDGANEARVDVGGSAESPFEAFSSDDDEDSGGVPAG